MGVEGSEGVEHGHGVAAEEVKLGTEGCSEHSEGSLRAAFSAIVDMPSREDLESVVVVTALRATDAQEQRGVVPVLAMVVVDFKSMRYGKSR